MVVSRFSDSLTRFTTDIRGNVSHDNRVDAVWVRALRSLGVDDDTIHQALLLAVTDNDRKGGL